MVWMTLNGGRALSYTSMGERRIAKSSIPKPRHSFFAKVHFSIGIVVLKNPITMCKMPFWGQAKERVVEKNIEAPSPL